MTTALTDLVLNIYSKYLEVLKLVPFDASHGNEYVT